MSGAVVRRERRVYSYGTGCTRCRRGLKASGPRRGGLDALVLLGGGGEPGGMEAGGPMAATRRRVGLAGNATWTLQLSI